MADEAALQEALGLGLLGLRIQGGSGLRLKAWVWSLGLKVRVRS